MRFAKLLMVGLVGCSPAPGETESTGDDRLAPLEVIVPDFDFGPGFDLGAARELSILYAGVPELDRGRAFLGFLRANFSKVDAIGLRSLDVETAAPYDVVVADWKLQWGPDGLDPTFEWPEIHLGFEFTKPIVAIASGPRSIQSHTKFRVP